MADVKISALPLASTPLAGTEVLPIVQSATTDQVSVANLTAGRAVSAASLTLTTTPLAVGSGGTGLTSLTTGYIPFGAGTSAFNNSANLTYSGTVLTAVGEIYASQAATNTQQIRLTPQSSGSNIIYSTYAGTNSYLPLVFNVGGSDRLTIATSGNVGIATASPSGILHTYATNGVNYFESPGISSVSLQFRTNGSDRYRIGIPNASADLAFWSDAGSTEVMRLSGGNLGLGVTPSAWGSGYKAIGINSYVDIASTNAGTIPLSLTQNAYYNGTNWVTKITSTSKRYEISDSGFIWYNGASATAGTTITFTQAMTLDAAGNLLVGTTSSASFLAKKLVVATGGTSNEGITVYSSSNNGCLWFANATSGSGAYHGGIDYQHSTNVLTFYSNSTGYYVLDGSGNIYPGIDNAQTCGKSGNRWSAVWAANGTIQTSDLAQKTDVKPSPLGIEFIKKLNPVAYKFKIGGNIVQADPDKPLEHIVTPIPGKRQHFGFIAQEVKAILPEGVDFGGWVKTNLDDPNSEEGLRYEQFIAPLVKAVQELAAKVAELEAKI